MGIPQMGIKGFLGKREEAIRAGIIPME